MTEAVIDGVYGTVRNNISVTIVRFWIPCTNKYVNFCKCENELGVYYKGQTVEYFEVPNMLKWWYVKKGLTTCQSFDMSQ